ncbi:MAG: AI-2E family transporter [Chlamydiales bacterium]|nr:AI-2E family transporter [Chlamydiales bacterium]
MKYGKEILFAFAIAISLLVFWYTVDVFLLAFAAILLALLLYSIGYWTKWLVHLPYVPSLLIGLIVILGLFTLIFWIYSPLIVEQFQMLVKQLPAAAINLRDTFAPFLNEEIFSEEHLKKEFSLQTKTIFTQVMTLFSTTVSSIVSFIIFLIVGFYLSLVPERYVKGFLYTVPKKSKEKVWKIATHIGSSLRLWLLGKVLSMIAIGIMTFLGLWLLHVPLALILGFLAGLLTFIPYVGPILAAIPATLIAFADHPIKAVWVILFYLGVHLAEGYFITPAIEQRTVSIPPALTIMGQILIFSLFGGLGLALATPLMVVFISSIVEIKKSS